MNLPPMLALDPGSLTTGAIVTAVAVILALGAFLLVVVVLSRYTKV